MRFSLKPAWLMIGLQAFCLCVGFWFLSQLVNSFTEQQAFEATQTVLTARWQPLAELAREQLSDPLNENPGTLTNLRERATTIPTFEQTGVLVADESWTILQPVTVLAERFWQTGEHLKWKDGIDSRSATEPIPGRVVTAEGDRAAVAYPLAGSTARLVVYDITPVVPLWRTQLMSSMPLAIAIALFWTLSLSSVATYLLSASLSNEELHRKTERDHDALKNAQDLLRTRDAVIFGLAKLAESRDPETGHHLERIALYCTCLATSLRSHPKFQRVVTPTFIRLLGISSVLHDIGKVGVEDTVLLKPGRLTNAERQKMQQHTLVAGDCLKEIEQRLGASNFLQTAREIAMYHHERWNGTGYPTGLTGEDIPLAARIVSIADVYDALSSKRCYKDAYPHKECVRLIREGSGTHFDPDLVNAFLAIEADFAAIARRFATDTTPTTDPSSELESTGTEPVYMTAKQETILRNMLATPVSCETVSEGATSVA